MVKLCLYTNSSEKSTGKQKCWHLMWISWKSFWIWLCSVHTRSETWVCVHRSSNSHCSKWKGRAASVHCGHQAYLRPDMGFPPGWPRQYSCAEQAMWMEGSLVLQSSIRDLHCSLLGTTWQIMSHPFFFWRNEDKTLLEGWQVIKYRHNTKPSEL